MRSPRIWPIAAVVLTGLLGGASAWGAESAAGSARSDVRGVEEVVVTARRREESMQDVPIAMTAFTGERLYKEFAVDLRDFDGSIPNFQLEQVGLFQSAAAFSARGVGTAGIESFADPVVAVFVDGQYYPRNANALLDMFDLEAVEVLRGPQGTLYGQNAFAGAVSVRTRRPTGERAARFEATVGDYNSRILKGAVESPLIDGRLNGKLSLIHRQFDGFFDVGNTSAFTNEELSAFVGEDITPFIGSNAQGEEKTVGRLSLQLLASENTEVNFIGTLERNRGDGSPGINGFFTPGGGPSVFSLFGFPGRDPFGDSTRGIDGDGSDPFALGANHRDINDQDLMNLVLEAKWDSPLGEWTTMVSYQDVESYLATDTDGELVDLFASEREEAYESWQFETRLNAQPTENSNLLLGLFVLQDEYDLSQLLLLGFGQPGDPGATPPLPSVPPYQFPQDIRQLSVGRNGQERLSIAPYVDFTYGLTPSLDLNLAVRATYEEKEAFNFPNQTPLGPAGLRPGKGDFDQVVYGLDCGSNSEDWFNVAPRIGFDFRPKDDVLLFAFWQRAFKSGGLLNNSATCGPFQDQPFDEERVDNYEVGIKSQWFDRRLLVNANVFYAEYTDLQRTVIRFAPDTPTQQETFTSNAAGATIWGVEVETEAFLTDRLQWRTNIGWLDASYDDFCTDLDGPGPFTGPEPTSTCGSAELLPSGLAVIDEDNSDLEFVRAPDWDLSTTLSYEVPLGRLGNLSADATYSYTDKLFTQVNNAVRTDRGEHQRLDASLTWSDARERYRLSVWGKNLNDDVERLSRTEVANLFTFEFPTAPRMWGVTFAADF